MVPYLRHVFSLITCSTFHAEMQLGPAAAAEAAGPGPELVSSHLPCHIMYNIPHRLSNSWWSTVTIHRRGSVDDWRARYFGRNEKENNSEDLHAVIAGQETARSARSVKSANSAKSAKSGESAKSAKPTEHNICREGDNWRKNNLKSCDPESKRNPVLAGNRGFWLICQLYSLSFSFFFEAKLSELVVGSI